MSHVKDRLKRGIISPTESLVHITRNAPPQNKQESGQLVMSNIHP